MPSVYQSDNFSGRVDYAAAVLVRGGSKTRHFDTCFEMWDGDLVVTALVRRATKNQRLYEAIARDWRGTFPQSWLDTAAKYADIPTRKLRDKAAEIRAEKEAASQRWIEEQRNKGVTP